MLQGIYACFLSPYVMDKEIDDFSVQGLRELPQELMHWAYGKLVPSERRFPVSFWLKYSEEQQAIEICALYYYGFTQAFKTFLRSFS